MKVLLINGSPHAHGCTATALNEVAKTLNENGVETELIQVGHLDIRGCIACGHCYKEGKCVFQDVVNEVAEKFKEADGIVLGSPVYYASANATLTAFADRLFYSSHFDKTIDQLNKYFSISSMPIVSSQYWNQVHGNNAEQVVQDLEGLQTMRTLGRNMAFLIKSIQLGKEQFGLPEKEPRVGTNFIR